MLKWHWKKISRKAAEDRYYCFETVYMIASKMRPDNIRNPPAAVSLEASDGEELDKIVNEFMFYNCNPECGKSVAFYVKEAEREA